MSNEEYIACIVTMLRQLNNKRLKRIFDYVHDVFIWNAGS